MAAFQDRQGRAWPVVISIPAARRIKQTLGFDLFAGDLPDRLHCLANDPLLLCDVLWLLCEPEAQARGCPREQFEQQLDGQAIEQATLAFCEAVADFSPPRTRLLLQRTMPGVQRKLQQAQAKLEALDQSGKLTELAEQAIDEAFESLGKESTGSPAPAGSTPAAPD